jgi:hypothetical protein
MIKFLLEEKANPYITSTVDDRTEETILETACRWNYLRIIRLYLAKFNWDKRTLKKALKLCTTKEAKNELKRVYKAADTNSIFDCMCCTSDHTKTVPIIN